MQLTIPSGSSSREGGPGANDRAAPIRRTAVCAAAILVILFASGPSRALDPDRALTQYVQDVWTRDDGLPHDVVSEILQARDGYLWLGTEEGLARFDGVRFTVFDSTNTAAFSRDFILSLFEDPDGTLWIGTRDGVVRRRNGEFEHFGVSHGLPDPVVLDIYRHSGGMLLVATRFELCRFAEGGFVPFTDEAGQTVEGVFAIGESGDASWFATQDGLFLLRDGLLRPLDEDVALQAAGAVDRDGTLWLGEHELMALRSNGRLDRVEAGEHLAGAQLSTLHLDASGSLWIGTTSKGLRRFRGGRFESLTRANGLIHDQIDSLFEDREGNLWIGTRGAGLARLRDGAMVTYSTVEGLGADFAHSIYQDLRGDIWIGTSGGGLNRLRDGRIEVFTTDDGLVHDDVLTTVGDSLGNLWVGTGQGLSRLRDGSFGDFEGSDDLAGAVIFSSCTDAAGNPVLGTSRGIARLAHGRVDTLEAFGGPRLPAALAHGPEGELWIGLFGLGLQHGVPGGDRITLTTADGLCSADVTALHFDEQGTLWIGTYGGGLCRYREGEFNAYTRKHGLHSDVVYQILEDDTGHLWMGSNDGIFRVARQELDDVAAGRIESVTSVVYGKRDGMRSPECNGGQQPAGWKARDGRLWFPTTAGVVVIDPVRLSTNDLPPPVHIEEVRSGKARVLVEGRSPETAVFSPGSDNLEIRYTALSFLDPGKVRFRYRMQGLDPDWIDAGTRRVAYYTNVPPGEYTFQVTACNNDGVWNEAGTSFAFVLEPRFHQTWVFWFLCVVAVAAATGGVYRLRVRQMRAREARLSAVIDERTRDLAEATRRLEETNQTLEQRVREGIDLLREAERMAAYGKMVASVAHEVRHPIFSMQAAAYVLRDKLRLDPEVTTQLRVLDRETGRMAALMDDLLEFARPQALSPEPTDPAGLLGEAAETFREARGDDAVDLKLKVANGLPSIAIDRRRMLQVFVNLMENAARHAEGITTITLAAENVDGHLVFKVANDGKGIAENHLPHIFEPFYTGGRGTGLGLAIVRRIVRDHKGSIEVESEPETGTRFTITLPTA
jgi:signal transduction histidine kinase/ligand-binding sensor domain-containing protein